MQLPAAPAAVTWPAGPQPQWTLTLPDEPSRLTVAQDGTVLALIDGELVAARAGAIAWRFGQELRNVLAVSGETVVVARRDPPARHDRLVMLAVADGSELGAAVLPPDGEEDEFSDWIHAAILAPTPEGVLVGDTVARWFDLKPGRCDKNRCLRAAGRLPEETLDSDARLSFGPGGRRILREWPAVRVFDAEWRTLVAVRGHQSIGEAVLGPEGLALVIDDDVVLLAVEACGSEVLAPSGWPYPNRLYARETDECSECAAPPPGCQRWRSYQEDAHSDALALLDGGGVVVHIDGETRAVRDGKPAWSTVTGGGGNVLRIGERLYGFSTGIEEDDPPAVYALDLEGRPQWRTPLTMKGPSLIYSTDDVVLAAAGSSLVAGFKANIAAFALQ
ncbi:hypothetical protein [Nannocystis punicea]|uniref:PQQ-like domain-containing protein n=1 Tax=Nannocystis punicea TaxID=2995304 RepID=A0ABY7H9W2_9BACT|nr:hypothetical protein [Nannocystis poenicansa]WAS96058.1 hypothetical protein O0S08_07825 [Nannocystis poenicansa]